MYPNLDAVMKLKGITLENFAAALHIHRNTASNKGVMTCKDIYQSWQSWQAYAYNFNAYRTIRSMNTLTLTVFAK